MKTKYGFQIYRNNDKTMRMEASGFFSKDRAVESARAELHPTRDSHAVILSYHWRGSKFIQARHITTIKPEDRNHGI